ncbi:MAG: hypothetical protein HZR80_05120 [Candidatus Heimdallarchaeota archaeon]
MKELTNNEEKWVEEQAVIIRDKNSNYRFNALNSIGFNAEASYPAIPALIDSLDFAGSYLSQTLWAIRRFKEKAYPHLLNALESNSMRIRFYACCLLPNEYYSKIEPIFVPLLKDSEFEERKNISWIFQNRDEQAIPTLRNLLTDDDSKVRYLASMVLDRVNDDIVLRVFPELIELLKDNAKSNIHTNILYRFIRLGKKAKQAIPIIIDKLDDRDVGVQHYAALVLAFIGTEAKGAISKLTLKLRESDRNDMKSVFAFALTRAEGKHDEGMDTLLELYKDGELSSNLKSEFEALLKEYAIDKELLEIERKTRENIQSVNEVSNNFASIKEDILQRPESEIKAFYVNKLSITEDSLSNLKELHANQLEITKELVQLNKKTNSTLHVSQLNQHKLTEQVTHLFEEPRLTEEQRREIIGKKRWYLILFGQFLVLIVGILVEIFASDIGKFNYIGISILGVLALLTFIISIMIMKNKI